MKFAIITKMNTLKESHKQRGDAIVAVLCILAILLALSAALLVSTNIVVNNNAEYKDEIQCKLAANSLARTLREKIVVKDDELTQAIHNLLNPNPESGAEWPYYDSELLGHGHSYADRIFTINDDEFKHTIVIYYEVDSENPDQAENFELVLELTTTYKNQTYKIFSRFYRVKNNGELQWYPSGNANDTGTQ